MSRTRSINDSRGARLLGASAVAMLALSLVACAPEDSELSSGSPLGVPENAAGATDKTGETPNSETEWGGQGIEDYVPSTELPASFPSDLFLTPDGMTLLDAGERGTGQWFLVLHADSSESAATLWNEIIESNNLAVSDEFETSEGGRAATLSSVSLSVQALTIPQSDDTVQLSYDIVRVI